MANINVPEQKLPKELLLLSNSENQEIRQMARAMVEYLNANNFFQYQMWKDVTDTPAPVVTEETIEEDFSGFPQHSSTQNLEEDPIAFHRATKFEDFDDVPPRTYIREFIPDIVTTNYTAVNNDFIDARAGITVQLDSNAGFNDQIITMNGDGSAITVSSTIQIRYQGQRGFKIILANEGTAIHWHLFSNGTEKFWAAR